MNLFYATLSAGAILLILGIAIYWNSATIRAAARALPRSRLASLILFGSGSIWFLVRLSTVGEADMIVFKSPWPIVAAFLVLAVLAYMYIREFLAVRGLCVLALLGAEPLLGAAYTQYIYPQRLLMVTAVYLSICLAIYLVMLPYRLRDFLEWLFLRRTRTRWIGAILVAYGVATTASAFTY